MCNPLSLCAVENTFILIQKDKTKMIRCHALDNATLYAKGDGMLSHGLHYALEH